MLALSGGPGIGGTVKSEPEDFLVREITSSGAVLEIDRRYTAAELGERESPDGKFTTFVLQKRNWETIRAALEVAKRTGRGRKSVSYAGTKDKRSVSVQLACIYGVEPASVQSVSMKDIGINGAWKSEGLELGSNLGNAFSVRLKDATGRGNIEGILSELSGVFPNYFDRQRFGYRLNNFRVGLAMLRGDHEEAAMIFLTDTSNENDEESRMARTKLAEEMDFRKALEYFPRHLRYERTMVEHLSKYKNFANAIRKLPRGISLMFVHSVEDLIFNMALEERIRAGESDYGIYCEKNFYGFPDTENVTTKGEGRLPLGALIGYETRDEEIGAYERGLMESLGLTKDLFRIKSMPELSMRGARRALFAPFRDFSASAQGTDALLNFSIPAGSYATVFLGEFIKGQGLDLNAMLRSAQALGPVQ